MIILVDIPVGIELSTNYWDQTNQTATYPCQWVFMKVLRLCLVYPF